MNVRHIPIEFALGHLSLTWKDIFWAYENQMLGWLDIVKAAAEKVGKGSTNEDELRLAQLQKGDAAEIGDIIRRLARIDAKSSDDCSKRKWLYLALAWTFQNRLNCPDSLGEVESIYADFSYPAEIEGFIPYMPVKDTYDPKQHTRTENEKRLFENWEKYLEMTKEELSRPQL
jgi:hypothetical protein